MTLRNSLSTLAALMFSLGVLSACDQPPQEQQGQVPMDQQEAPAQGEQSTDNN